MALESLSSRMARGTLADALEHPRVLQPRPGLEDEHPADAHGQRALLGRKGGAIGG